MVRELRRGRSTVGRQGARRPQGGAGRACLSSARGSLSPRLLASSPAATAPRLHPARQLGRQREGWGLALSVHGFHARLRRRAPWGPERAAGSAARSSAPRPSPTRLPPCRACGQPSDACRARAMGQAESRAAGLQGEGAPSPQRTETQTSGRRSHAGMPGYKPRHALRPWGGGGVWGVSVELAMGRAPRCAREAARRPTLRSKTSTAGPSGVELVVSMEKDGQGF